jgi:uncharacterized protein (TIGR02186 family)
MTAARALLALAALALSALLQPAAALAQGGAFLGNDPTVAAALTDDLISINSRFTGARIDVFGVVNGLGPEDDVVVVVRGPETPVMLMRKSRILGVWINGQPTRFEKVPAYYATASTRPIEEIAPREELARHDIGIENAPLRPVGDDAARVMTELEAYRAAIVRIKASDGLYRNVPGGVDVYDGGLFRARMLLPPGSPVGTYRADVFVFRDGVSAARRSTELQVVKVGLELFISAAAHDHPLFYGIATVMLALSAGWLAALAYRRI